MRIDAHQHFWEYNSKRDIWIDDSMEVIRRDFLPEHLESILKQNNVDGCIAIQADQSEAETTFLLDCAKENTFIKGVVGWVDLCADNIEKRLSYFSTNLKFKGVRHIVQAEASDYMLQQDFQNGIAKLEKFNLTYDILIFPEQLSAAVELVNKFPNQKFVLDHIAKPNIAKSEIESWRTNIQNLAKYKNVYCKLSGMLTESNIKDSNYEDFVPYMDVVFDVFGVDRILYGSDWPVCLLAGDYNDQLQVLERYISNLSEESKSKVMGENAIKFYNLNS